MKRRLIARAFVGAAVAGGLVAGATLTMSGQNAGTTPRPAGPGGGRGGAPGTVTSFPDAAFLRWPLAPADKAYAAIDGQQLKQHVADLTAISRKYRDAGHQF